MIRELWNLILGRSKPPPDILASIPATDVPTPPFSNDDILVPLVAVRDVLKRRTDDVVMRPNAKVTSRNNVELWIADVPQKPPYVICTYNGRRVAVRAENVGCYWTTVVVDRAAS